MIGLDVGGTKIAGGLVDPCQGEVLVEHAAETRPERGPHAVCSVITAMAEDLLAEARQLDRSPRCIGVGVPELVSLTGEVTTGDVLGLRGTAVYEKISRLLPAVIASDVRAAALAEAVHGAGRDHTTFVYMSVGTGISICLVQDRIPYTGARGNALVLTGNPLSISGNETARRPPPLLEEFAAGPALVTRYNNRRGASADGADAVLAAAVSGDDVAAEIVRTAAEALGAGLAHVVGILDPAAIVVGGGLGLAGGPYWNHMVASTRDHIWAERSRDLPIVPAALGQAAGVIGAGLSATRDLTGACGTARAESTSLECQ